MTDRYFLNLILEKNDQLISENDQNLALVRIIVVRICVGAMEIQSIDFFLKGLLTLTDRFSINESIIKPKRSVNFKTNISNYVCPHFL